MNTIISLMEASATIAILLPIISIILTWLFIRSAVASGTKKAILEAFEQINHPDHKEEIEEEVREEMKGWS